MNVGLFDSFITRGWYNAAARRVWSDTGTLQAWLKVEACLAWAQGELGVIPREAAQEIDRHVDIGGFDLDRLTEDIAFAQHPFVPVLRQFEKLCGEPAAGYLHWGATTQNIFDTANALQMAETHALTLGFLDEAIARLAVLAQEHRLTLQAGRTHGQHALPMTFGFKVAGWLDELVRDRARLAERFASSFVVCMGGAIGTFAAMGPRGPEVERLMAEKLGLQAAGLPARASCDRICDYLSTLALLAGTTEKIARDIVFLQRTEVGEVAESFHLGKVGSSTMAQKRNPSTSLMLISMARLLRSRVTLCLECMARMDEGDSSATNVNDVTLPEIAVLAVSLAETLQRLVAGLTVSPKAMAHNARLTHGLIVSEAVMMRLTESMGRHEAHHLLYEVAQRAISEGLPFLELLREQLLVRGKDLPAGLNGALAVENYVGESARLADEAVARARRGLATIPA
ncbi:adenylosuccinate lyase family protein [Oleiharenicola lentus]|jgi:adenylosuccinate lyase/3-carboxy-cis,cis-muconate cycloisomerase|uniref:Adenylosuccinate lyase family protein n=1 Tax=Oleiharenicola lentus TaxID=2508720 RepID=A0A4Q1C5Q7_9BACT|nr:adenylosuccinate lyase family protein [Oleiharenicola lentus]RXK53673.1 adenylosuccinate lyase family protein [Oleiharenicola lentus]